MISSTSGPMPRAEKGRRGEVERELLHRGIELHLAGGGLPLRNPRRNPGIKRGQIGFHRSGLEGDRERAPVQAMLVEIEQHQPARKQPAEHDLPAMGRGEQLLLVEQHEFVGFRTKCRDAGFAEHVAAIDRPVFRGHPLDFTLGVREDVKRAADERPTFVAGNMPQRTGLRRGKRAMPASTWQLLLMVPASIPPDRDFIATADEGGRSSARCSQENNPLSAPCKGSRTWPCNRTKRRE